MTFVEYLLVAMQVSFPLVWMALILSDIRRTLSNK